MTGLQRLFNASRRGRPPETRRVAWLSLGSSAFIAILLGGSAVLSRLGLFDVKPIWLDLVFVAAAAANVAFAWTAIRRLREP